MSGFDEFAKDIIRESKREKKNDAVVPDPILTEFLGSDPVLSSDHFVGPDITGTLFSSIDNADTAPSVTEVGEVVYVGDGICKVSGLRNAGIDDVIKIKTATGDVQALVLGLSEDTIESVVLGDYIQIKKGDTVIATNKPLKIPSGENVLGRVMSPIGIPIDGEGSVKQSKLMDVERLAPLVYMRKPITEGLKTGFLVMDSIIPIGRGQRELIVGDKKTGKSRLMSDIICNLKGLDIVCVYVAIGAQKVKVKAFVKYLKEHGALDYTAVVVATSDDPPSLNYLAPYSGTSIAEYFCDAGKDCLVIFDDLSKHAKAYRQMSLLLKRSPGRDAYPGDIFYLHSRLLERSSKLGDDYGGGSITCFPICETQNGDVSEYITTNLMSITDGHTYLDGKMMHDGILPAVGSGVSVSRIGGGVQPVLLRKLGAIAGQQLARYEEVKSYETINTAITEETEREINRGKRILEIFTQPSGVNYSLAEESILLQLATSGTLDFVDNLIIRKMKAEIVDYYRINIDSYKELTENCESKDREAEEKGKELVDACIKDFVTKVQSESTAALKKALFPEEDPRQKVEAVKEVIKEVNKGNKDIVPKEKPAEPDKTDEKK